MDITIFIDGSCDWKSKLGGIGVYIISGEQEWFFNKGFKQTTISRMEGMALLVALRSLNKEVAISATIYSDSEYITKSFTENRLTKWAMIGWSSVKNILMWKAIIKEIEARPLLKLTFKHTRGHRKNLEDPIVNGNAIADLLASYKIHKFYYSDNFN